ncbi:MAG: acyl-CoA dehydrogenase family protein, partial [Gemmobacter sp.]
MRFQGGYGFMRGYGICRLYADARLQRIYGGTSEILRELISRALWPRPPGFTTLPFDWRPRKGPPFSSGGTGLAQPGPAGGVEQMRPRGLDR